MLKSKVCFYCNEPDTPEYSLLKIVDQDSTRLVCDGCLLHEFGMPVWITALTGCESEKSLKTVFSARPKK